MPSQTVIRLTSRTGPDALQAFNEPIPTIGPGEILVRVRSVALNYRDIVIATGEYPLPIKKNVIPASDVAGEVVEIGAKVDEFAVGDAVLAPISYNFQYGIVTQKAHQEALGGERDGALAEYIVMPVYGAIKVPETNHSFAQWAAFVAAGGTAWNSFFGSTPLRVGQTVLVLGTVFLFIPALSFALTALKGTGGVSLVALIIAKAAGAITIITSSNDEKLKHVKDKHGADHVINYKKNPDWASEVMRITNGEGADHIIEVGGNGTIEQSLKAVKRGGLISMIGYLAPTPGDKIPEVTQTALYKAVTIRGLLGASKQQLEEAVQCMAALGLQMPIGKTFGFTRDEVVAAYKYLASGENIGKVCINFD